MDSKLFKAVASPAQRSIWRAEIPQAIENFNANLSCGGTRSLTSEIC